MSFAVRLAWISASALVASAVAGACSPANVAGAASSSACHDYAYNYCQRLATCAPTAIPMRYGTTAVCESIYEAQCAGRFGLTGSSTTAATIAACQAALPSWDCPDFIISTNPPEACQPVPGTLPPGAPCATNAQCSTAYCSGLAHALCGKCGTAPAEGASCVDDLCTAALTCRGTPPVCVAYALASSPCNAITAPCAEGLICVNSTGTCEPAVGQLGATCVAPQPGCDQFAGLSCDASQDKCVPLQLVQAGAACGTAVGDQAVACLAGICPRGVCIPFPQIGEPCTVGAISACQPGVRCVGGAPGTAGTCVLGASPTCN